MQDASFLGETLIFLIAAVAVLGRLVVRPVFRAIAVGQSTELFAAVTLAVLLGMSWLTATFGLSIAIGGFLAGSWRESCCRKPNTDIRWPRTFSRSAACCSACFS